MSTEDISGITLESRTPAQNRSDIEHFNMLRERLLSPRLRIEHVRGGDEPLLWIPDAVLGAIITAARGNAEQLRKLEQLIVVRESTPDSIEISRNCYDETRKGKND